MAHVSFVKEFFGEVMDARKEVTFKDVGRGRLHTLQVRWLGLTDRQTDMGRRGGCGRIMIDR